MGNSIMLMTESLNKGTRSYFRPFELELRVDLICWCSERSTTEEFSSTDCCCCIEPIPAALNRCDLTSILMGSCPTITSFYSLSQQWWCIHVSIETVKDAEMQIPKMLIYSRMDRGHLNIVTVNWNGSGYQWPIEVKSDTTLFSSLVNWIYLGGNFPIRAGKWI